jgi:hypothetical protein
MATDIIEEKRKILKEIEKKAMPTIKRISDKYNGSILIEYGIQTRKYGWFREIYRLGSKNRMSRNCIVLEYYIPEEWEKEIERGIGVYTLFQPGNIEIPLYKSKKIKLTLHKNKK